MNGFKFGVEIEFTGVGINTVVDALTAAGVSAFNAGYTHQVFQNRWKLVTDGSVTDYNGIGGELVSPPLSGEQGIEELRKVASVVNAIPGIKVDRRCGLHVHVSWDGMTADQIKSVVSRFIKYEGWFDSIFPASRRNNRFCKTVNNALVSMALAARVQEARELAIYANDRYQKLNLCSLTRYGTIEFRQHSGTTDPDKIVNWVLFLEKFIEASVGPAEISASTSYTRRTNRPYGEIREQLERNGAAVRYAGGRKWEIRLSDGRQIFASTEQLDSLYVNGTRQLNDSFCKWWKDTVGSTADNIYANLDQSMVEYFNSRQARFASV